MRKSLLTSQGGNLSESFDSLIMPTEDDDMRPNSSQSYRAKLSIPVLSRMQVRLKTTSTADEFIYSQSLYMLLKLLIFCFSKT